MSTAVCSCRFFFAHMWSSKSKLNLVFDEVFFAHSKGCCRIGADVKIGCFEWTVNDAAGGLVQLYVEPPTLPHIPHPVCWIFVLLSHRGCQGELLNITANEIIDPKSQWMIFLSMINYKLINNLRIFSAWTKSHLMTCAPNVNWMISDQFVGSWECKIVS